MMNVYLFELRMYKKSIVIWCLAIAVSMVIYLGSYPSIAADSAAFDDLMANYPPEFLAFFGMSSELSVGSLLGYFSMTFAMMLIPVAIQASNYGFHMLSVEERELTADFLLSKPITRTKILTSKFFAAFTALTCVNISLWISTIFSLSVFNAGTEVDFTNIYILLSTIVLFQLFFVSVGMLISVSVRKIPSVLSFSMALSVGLYILQGLKSIFSSKLLSYFTPYAYFEPVDILLNGKYNLYYTTICVLVIITSLYLTYVLYNKRNIHSL